MSKRCKLMAGGQISTQMDKDNPDTFDVPLTFGAPMGKIQPWNIIWQDRYSMSKIGRVVKMVCIGSFNIYLPLQQKMSFTIAPFSSCWLWSLFHAGSGTENCTNLGLFTIIYKSRLLEGNPGKIARSGLVSDHPTSSLVPVKWKDKVVLPCSRCEEIHVDV